ncbi:replication protein A 70 kDa DNA-binding subunit E-like [Vicia villosa]|uniref:replication protein A 70 kDa DNA-binding subunit E-like n=1 Tax=Vicia villosa TaxID=3911 RepID=UPI00273AC635|nr:replication protein A 70 kDa DNA-binding subunit E-like [Vicia villosa]
MFYNDEDKGKPMVQLTMINRNELPITCTLSDGFHSCYGIIAPSVDESLISQLKSGAMIHLTSFLIVNYLKRIISIERFVVVYADNAIVGNPKLLPWYIAVREIKPALPQPIAIIGRVIAKSEMYSQMNEEGINAPYSFYFDVIDQHYDRVRVTCFGRDNVEKFYPKIIEDEIYSIVAVDLKVANKRYNLLHPYELIITSATSIEKFDDGNMNIPTHLHNYITVRGLSGLEVKTVLDFIAIVVRVGPIQTKEKDRRVLLLQDPTGQVNITLWGHHCEKTPPELSVVAFQSVSLEEYKGIRKLSTTGISRLWVEPPFAEATRIRNWYTRRNQAQSLGEEPEEEEGPNATKVLVRFPNGERKERRFNSTVTVQSLYDYVDSLGCLEENYTLVSNFPRVVYGEEKLRLSLIEAGLHPQATLFVELAR